MARTLQVFQHADHSLVVVWAIVTKWRASGVVDREVAEGSVSILVRITSGLPATTSFLFLRVSHSVGDAEDEREPRVKFAPHDYDLGWR